jgi:hypothetical protein
VALLGVVPLQRVNSGRIRAVLCRLERWVRPQSLSQGGRARPDVRIEVKLIHRFAPLRYRAAQEVGTAVWVRVAVELIWVARTHCVDRSEVRMIVQICTHAPCLTLKEMYLNLAVAAQCKHAAAVRVDSHQSDPATERTTGVPTSSNGPAVCIDW